MTMKFLRQISVFATLLYEYIIIYLFVCQPMLSIIRKEKFLKRSQNNRGILDTMAKYVYKIKQL